MALNRRRFFAASAVMGAAPLAVAAAAPENRQYLELRQYQQLVGSRRALLTDYLRDAAIPAWNRLGIGPVGVFSVRYGPNAPSLYVLLPHPTLESVATATSRLMADPAHRQAGRAFLDTPLSDPALVRMESSLMRAFTQIPRVEVPLAVSEHPDRVFELRIYESHSEPMARKKVEMFNEGGEIGIFRQTGLRPVFFGETLIGTRMPNLTYLLAFTDLAERDRNWGAFGSADAWKALSAREEYRDTVSNITDIILRPEPYSQI